MFSQSVGVVTKKRIPVEQSELVRERGLLQLPGEDAQGSLDRVASRLGFWHASSQPFAPRFPLLSLPLPLTVCSERAKHVPGDRVRELGTRKSSIPRGREAEGWLSGKDERRLSDTVPQL